MSYREELKTLRYGDHLAQMFDVLFEDWMEESDRNWLVNECLTREGVTLAKLDEDIQTGVDNGVSADEQVQIAASALRQLKQPTTPETAKD
ncbi:hypothetical protein D3C76_367610 [compost metagenome]